MTTPIEETIFSLLSAVQPGKTIAPEDVAKTVDLERWRKVLPQVRSTAIGLARDGRLVITRHNKPADPESFKGVWRMRLPSETDAPTSAD